jgi:hypothetical protein
MTPVIEEAGDIEVSDSAAALLREMLGELPDAERRGRPRSIGVADMSAAEFKSYKAEKARERRARIRASIEDDGVLPYDAATAREALADAALLILAGDLAGAENVRRYLQGVFREQPGAPLSIEAAAKSGRLKPKYIELTQPKSK